MKQESLDYWRNYFRAANSDIFGIIDYAITVAASDCPKDFRLRRDRIAERLFTCRLTRCSGCDRVELAVPDHDSDGESDRCKIRDGVSDDDDDNDDDIEIDIEGGCEFEDGSGSKESKVNSCNNGEVNVNDYQLVSNYGYEEAEALTDEIEEESQIVGEVLRIKNILLGSKDESDSVLFESLRKLELMALTVDILKATEIGKAVNVLRRHGSTQIRLLARTLINGWKVLVDEWCDATKALRGDEGTPESVNPSVVEEEEEEEEGLPSPPLDEAAFFATQPTSMELSQFFDGIDDYEIPQSSVEFIKNRDKGRKPPVENQNMTKRKQHATNEANVLVKHDESKLVKSQEAPMKGSKSLNNNSGPGRPQKASVQHKASNELKLQQNPVKITSQRKPSSVQQDKIKCSDEAAVQMKLEATKRKLQERYQQAENAKRQRTVQVMELQDLPKQGHVQKNPHGRPGNYSRNWLHGRR
ncbi:hypothetical protein K2173_014983 [Erythroxylum novogranatense]|uniref:TFIIS N-terminal domain-containing protein n=1 Tax=Erythroxylum novogranatense TaxID=1862640 RepID=A0AAV8TWY4_9ROSI|nr:hypothetical protein K2173_014983 [Erythroxylum novogranatense]